MDVLDQQDCYTNINRIAQLFRTGIFQPAGLRNPLAQSAFIELTICLNDLLQKCHRLQKRVTFADDLEAGDSDVTEAVRQMRNACCHIPSGERHLDEHENRGSFLCIVGHQPNAFMINGRAFGCGFADDAAIYYGDRRLYLVRHVQRAFREAQQTLAPELTIFRRPG